MRLFLLEIIDSANYQQIKMHLFILYYQTFTIYSDSFGKLSANKVYAQNGIYPLAIQHKKTKNDMSLNLMNYQNGRSSL